ncbi:MAG TPA: enoyl-CoA hydratase-related protein [Syntrophorhabdales bacterium]|nr:enoyl-CoA hydratase-related protein [Syntrophorhabdales bacterium]
MDVLVETFVDGVFTITLNRPEKKNAMSLELLKRLSEALERAENQRAAIIVIRGAGKTFCAGGDILEFRQSAEIDVQIDCMADYLHKSIQKIREINAIVIAVVEGLAFGAGLSLSLACDLTVAETKATMNMAYRRIGLSPDGGGSFFLSRLVGAKKFNELYLLSRNIEMQEARELGLVNFVFSDQELDTKLAELVRDLKALPAESISRFKELVNLSLFSGLSSHLDRERRFVTELGSGPEFKQRLDAILKK